MTVWEAFGLVALGMTIDRIYSIMGWRKYYEGRGDYEERKRK